jgi:WD40 repeat protein
MRTPMAAWMAATLAVLLAGCDRGDAPVSWHEYALQGAYTASLSEQGRYAVVGSIQHGGSLWDTSSNARLFNWNHKPGEFSIIATSALSPDETFAATAGQQDLVLWNLISGKPVWYWSSPAEILAMDLNRGADFALLGLANHEAVYFDIKHGGVTLRLRHDARVRALDLSLDGRLALTGSDAYRARLWDLQTGEQLHSLEFGNVVDTVALSPDGKLAFSSGSLDRAIIWDTRSGEVRHTLSDFRSLFESRLSYLSARFSGNGEQLLTGSTAGIVQLWDVATGREIRRWRVHKRAPYGPTSTAVYAVAFASDGYLAIGSNGLINLLR